MFASEVMATPSVHPVLKPSPKPGLDRKPNSNPSMLHVTLTGSPCLTKVRPFYMHKHGGMYADVDFEALKDLTPLLKVHNCT